MVRHCLTMLTDRDKEGIFVQKLRGSEALKPHIDYYDRCDETHADHSYSWVSQLMDKLIRDTRRRRNAESLVLEASGKEQPSKHKVSVPAAMLPDAVPAMAALSPGVPSPSPDPKKGKGKGKGGKGKGKGQSGSDSETGYATDQYPGTAINDIPEAERCCVFHLYVDKNGETCCKPTKNGKPCKMQHLQQPTKAMLNSKVYTKYCTLWGQPNAFPAVAGGAGN